LEGAPPRNTGEKLKSRKNQKQTNPLPRQAKTADRQPGGPSQEGEEMKEHILTIKKIPNQRTAISTKSPAESRRVPLSKSKKQPRGFKAKGSLKSLKTPVTGQKGRK